MLGLLTHTLVLGAVLGAIAAPWNAAAACQCSQGAANSADQTCCCCKSANKSARPCCQARTCCQPAKSCCQKKASGAGASFGCCCKHGQPPAAPAPVGNSEIELKQVLSNATILALPVATEPEVFSSATPAACASHAGRSVQSLLCRWTV